MDDVVNDLKSLNISENTRSKFYDLVFSADHRDIYDIIFDACSPKTMIRLGLAGNVSHTALKDYMRRRFNIIKHLARYFEDPSSFRRLQAATNLIVSGSNGLQFMNRCFYPESDLDLYVNVRNAYTACEWILTQNEGYKFVAIEDQDSDFETAWNRFETSFRFGRTLGDGLHEANTARGLYGLNRVLAIFTFGRGWGKIDDERKIQVIVTELSPLVSVLNFHSTVVMNFITHKAAYSLFPNQTFEEHLTLYTSNRTEQREQAIQKYVDRGWEVVRFIPLEDSATEDASFRYGKRWITDNQSWVIPFDTTDVGREDDPFAFASFNLSHHLGGLNQPEITFSTIKYSTLPEPLVTNREISEKVQAYIRVLAYLYGEGKSKLEWTPDFYSDKPPSIVESIYLISDTCKKMCTCSCRQLSVRTMVTQMLLCPAFKKLEEDLSEFRAVRVYMNVRFTLEF